jgi:hypothetical protein
LWPLIFIINSTGVPARNSLVQNERLAVCEVINSYFGLVITTVLFPVLYEKFYQPGDARQFANCF